MGPASSGVHLWNGAERAGRKVDLGLAKTCKGTDFFPFLLKVLGLCGPSWKGAIQSTCPPTPQPPGKAGGWQAVPLVEGQNSYQSAMC